MERTVTIDPHHPDCRGSEATTASGGSWAGYDPERCSYCAALVRQELGMGRNEDPLDYRYRGPIA